MELLTLLWFTLVLVSNQSSFGDHADVFGVVVDPQGHPVEQASVLELTRSKPATQTDTKGFFRISDGTGAVLVEHPGFAPIIFVATERRERPIKLVLAERSPAEWRVPPCSRAHTDTSPMKTLDIGKPKGTKVRAGVDADYELISIRAPHGRGELRFWKHVVSDGRPGPVWLRGLQQLRVRPIRIADTEGLDVRGKTVSGGVSRWVGCIYTILEYSDVDPSAAKLFDNAIDGACYR